MSVSEMLCRRVLLTVCILGLYECEYMFAGYCDALRCMRYAFVAAPALHAMPCMTVKDVWSVTVRESTMLCILGISVHFHVNRWSG